MRTTLDLDEPILKELKARKAAEGKSLGRLVSDLLADSLGRNRPRQRKALPRWVSRPMSARVDLDDKDAVYSALDG
jgi:hypothetical protein